MLVFTSVKCDAFSQPYRRQQINLLLIMVVLFNTMSSIMLWRNSSQTTQGEKAQMYLLQTNLDHFLKTKMDLAEVMLDIDTIKMQVYEMKDKVDEIIQTQRKTLTPSSPRQASLDSSASKYTKQSSKQDQITKRTRLNPQHAKDSERKLVHSLFSHSLNSVCDDNPILSPLNHINNFQFDERIDNILKLLYGLSSIESLEKIDSPQRGAACWMIYDDEQHFNHTDDDFIQRYIVATILFSCEEHEEITLLTLDTCDYDMIKCNEFGNIVEIDMSELAPPYRRKILE